MRTLLSLLALLCALAGVAPAQSDAETQEQLLAILHKMYAAEKTHDLAVIRSYLSDDFAEAAGDGAVYRWKDIEAGSADMQLRDYQLSDCLTKLIAPSAAYLSCRMEVDASYKGTPIPRLMRVTWVWSRANDRWLLRFEQATVIPAAETPQR